MDERMQITITDVDTVSTILYSNFTPNSEVTIDIKSAPALIQVFSNFHQIDQKRIIYWHYDKLYSMLLQGLSQSYQG